MIIIMIILIIMCLIMEVQHAGSPGGAGHPVPVRRRPRHAPGEREMTTTRKQHNTTT